MTSIKMTLSYMRMYAWIGALLLMLIGSFALLPPPAFGADNVTYAADKRIKLLRYDENDIYTIYTLYGYQTSIELSKAENIQTISIGERSLWQIVPAGHRLFIRPMDDNVATNMTVITDRRTYQFDLKSGAGVISDNPKMVYVARFLYPEKPSKKMSYMPPATTQAPAAMAAPSASDAYRAPPIATAPTASAAAPMSAPAAPNYPRDIGVALPSMPPVVSAGSSPATVSRVSQPPAMPGSPVELSRFDAPPTLGNTALADATLTNDETLNYYYTYAGSDTLAPLELYDDGTATFMRFASMASLKPKLYAIDGEQRIPLDYTITEEGMIMVESIYAQMELDYSELGQQKVYVYNETLIPAGR